MNLDRDMHRWTGNSVFESEAEAQAELERFILMDTISTWMIVDNLSGHVVGRFFILVGEKDKLLVAGGGNRIAKPYWRKGHNRESIRLIFPYVFDILAVNMIEWAAWSENTNSLRSMEAHGFRFDRDEQRFNPKYGKDMTMRFCTMTEDQWIATVNKTL